MDAAVQMPKIDAEGYLIEPQDWSKNLALEFTRQENIQLSDEHRMGELTCGEIMSRDLVTAEFATELEEVWAELRFHRVKTITSWNWSLCSPTKVCTIFRWWTRKTAWQAWSPSPT